LTNRRFSLAQLIGLLVLGSLLSSCVGTFGTLASKGIEKRRYTAGYHIDILDKKVFPSKSRATPSRAAFYKKQTQRLAEEIVAKNLIQQSLGKGLQADSTECGDLITFRSGETVKAKITTVGTNDITYKRCDNLNGPNYVVTYGTIMMIEFNNGEIEAFEEYTQEENAEDDEYHTTATVPQQTEKEYSPYKDAEGALLFGILSLVLLVPFGFLFGIAAIAKGSRALKILKDSSRERNMATAAIIMGAVSILVAILVMGWIVLILFSF